MADERRAHDYDVALATIGYLGAALAKTLRAEDANPYRRTPPRRKTAAEVAEESEEGWELLKTGLAFVAKSGGKGGA